MKRSVFVFVLPIILCCSVAGASAEGGAGIEVALEPVLSDLGTVQSTIRWEAAGDGASISLKAPEGVSVVMEGGGFLTSGDRHVLGPVAAGEEMRVEIFGLEEGHDLVLAVERMVGRDTFQLVTVIGFAAGHPAVLDASPYRIFEKESDLNSGSQEKTVGGQHSVSFRPSQGTIVVESLQPKTAAFVFADDPTDVDIPISAPDRCSPNFLFSTTRQINVNAAPAGAVTTDMEIHVVMAHWDASQMYIACSEDGYYTDPAHPNGGKWLWKDENFQVDIDETWSRDKYNQDLPGIGYDTNGWFQLWFVDCTGGAVGTLHYWSVEATYETSNDYDLLADSITPQSGSVAAGSSINVNWFGHADAGNSGDISGDFTVGFYLSNDSNVTTGDTLLDRVTIVGPTSPGESFGANGRSLLIPGGTVAGTRYLGIVVDDTGSVAETNENNNVVSSAINVTSGGGGQADVLPTGCTVSPSSVEAGDQVTMNWTERNQGSADAPEYWTRIYHSSNTTYEPGTDIMLGQRSPGPIVAGGQELVSIQPSIPSSTTDGTWYLLVVSDDDDDVAESNENNNVCYATVTVGSGGGPDISDRWLIPAAASASGFGGSDWRSQIAVTNSTNKARTARVYYVSDTSSWPGVLLTGPVTIGARQSYYVDDVLRTLRPTSGLLYVVLDVPGPVVTSRTYNLASDGSTFGQGIPGIPLMGGSVPTELILPMVHSGAARYHTNLGVVQASNGSMTVEISIYTAGGSLLASQQRSVTDGWDQINDVFDKFGVGAAAIEGGWIKVRLVSGSPDAWTCYASVVDKETGDPTYIAGVQAE